MGNADSTYYSTVFESWRTPELVPKVTDKPKHDPNYGFKETRTERGLILLFLLFLKKALNICFF